MKKLFFILALALPISVQANTLVCSSRFGDNIKIVLNAYQKQGKTMSCMMGEGFDVDGEGCAPNGIYAIYYPTGLAQFREFARKLPNSFENYRFFAKRYNEYYFKSPSLEFRISRTTGHATLIRDDNNIEITYFCKKINHL